MKKYLFPTILSVIIITIFTIQSTNAKSIFRTVRGDKNIINKEVKIVDYNSIILSGNADIIYEQKEYAAPYLNVEIDNNLFEYLDIQVIGKDLMIKQKSSTSINPSKYIIKTNSKQLEKVNILGSGKVLMLGNIKTNILDLTVKGSGDILINELSANSMNAEVMGSGDISFSGKIKSNTISLTVKGSGDISINDLDVDSVTAQVMGSGDISSSGKIKSNTMSLMVKGSGDISIKNLDVNSVTAQMVGSGDIKISGKAKSGNYSVTSSGDIKAKKLEIETAICRVSGSGDIEVNPMHNLDCSIKGSGNIHYLGNPSHIQKNIKGSGDIKQIK